MQTSFPHLALLLGLLASKTGGSSLAPTSCTTAVVVWPITIQGGMCRFYPVTRTMRSCVWWVLYFSNKQ